MTKQLIGLAGTAHCCSVCGDEEDISDYWLKDKKTPPDAVLTLRLCNDCLNIRKDNGENFSTFPKSSPTDIRN